MGEEGEEQTIFLTKKYRSYISNKKGPVERHEKGKAIGAKETEQRMLHIRVPVSVHKSLRIRAAEQDTTIQKLVVRMITHGLGFQNTGH